MTPVPKIKLYVDAVSPFGYIVYHVLRHNTVFKNCEITYIPIFLGGLMKACGNTPPLHIKNKDVWIDRERLRWARTFNVPMREDLPPNFPPLTLSLMRHLAALHEIDGNQSRLVQVLDNLSSKFWTEHDEIHKPEVFLPMLKELLGETDAQRVSNAASKEGKEALTRNTDQAFQEKAFGLPWITCTNSRGQTETFWGADHLGQVTTFLGLDRPMTGGWKSVL